MLILEHVSEALTPTLLGLCPATVLEPMKGLLK